MLQWVPVDSYQAAARLVIKGEVDASFFLAEAFALAHAHDAQPASRCWSRARSRHLPRGVGQPAHRRRTARGGGCAGRHRPQPQDHEVLEALGIPGGFTRMPQEDAEFMVDLMGNAAGLNAVSPSPVNDAAVRLRLRFASMRVACCGIRPM
jgi:hypothetical protein